MVSIFQDLYAYLGERNLKPKMHVLDNECSRAIKTFIRKEGAEIQLVEPYNHRVNAAETAVKVAKYRLPPQIRIAHYNYGIASSRRCRTH